MKTSPKRLAKARKYMRRYYHEMGGRAKHLARHMLKKYGMTPEDKEAMFARQGRRCAACGSLTSGSSRDWPIDHNHQTNKVRGILCNPCNSALGHALEDPLRLRALADYIERTNV